LLQKALGITQKVPPPESEEKPDGTWTNTWHWVLSSVISLTMRHRLTELSDASCGHLLFSVTDGRVSAETKSTGRSSIQPEDLR